MIFLRVTPGEWHISAETVHASIRNTTMILLGCVMSNKQGLSCEPSRNKVTTLCDGFTGSHRSQTPNTVQIPILNAIPSSTYVAFSDRAILQLRRLTLQDRLSLPRLLRQFPHQTPQCVISSPHIPLHTLQLGQELVDLSSLPRHLLVQKGVLTLCGGETGGELGGVVGEAGVEVGGENC